MDYKRTVNFKPRLPRKTPPCRAFFTWEIHYACNYKCSYCHAPKPWNPEVKKAVYLETRDWLRIWYKIYEDYGSCRILVSGGEPFTYPSFMELIPKLARIHFLEFCTNLSWDVKPFIKYLKPRYVKVGTSFHPEFADLGEFLEKIRLLKDAGFDTMVNFVPWPPLLDNMREYKERIEALGVQFVLQPFIGQYQGRQYPQGYIEPEREYFKIFKDDCNRNTLDFKTTEKSNNKGKLCRMGQNYAFIRVDGSASRCCRDHSLQLGNIVDGTFKLLEEPSPCQIEECNCWRFMEVGRESEWANHWNSSDTERVTTIKVP